MATGWGATGEPPAPTPPLHVFGVCASDGVAVGGGGVAALLLQGRVYAENGRGAFGFLAFPGQVLAVSCGGAHALALLADGSLHAIGSNAQGQCGVAAALAEVAPLPRPCAGAPPGTRFTAIAAGEDFSLALAADGSLWACGSRASHEFAVVAGGFGGAAPCAVFAGARGLGLVQCKDGSAWASCSGGAGGPAAWAPLRLPSPALHASPDARMLALRDGSVVQVVVGAQSSALAVAPCAVPPGGGGAAATALAGQGWAVCTPGDGAPSRVLRVQGGEDTDFSAAAAALVNPRLLAVGGRLALGVSGLLQVQAAPRTGAAPVTTVGKVGSIWGLCLDATGGIIAAASNKLHRLGLMGENEWDSPVPFAKAASFNDPRGLCLLPSGKILVVDNSNNRLQVISEDGSSASTLVSGLNWPNCAVCLPSGEIIATDSGHHQIARVTPQGTKSLLAGSSTSGSTDGKGASATFDYPNGVCLLPSGDILVADSYAHVIRRLTPDGTTTTIAGTAGRSGHLDGPGMGSLFSSPQGLQCDKNGNVYVVDKDNHCIRVISPAGEVSTIAGRPGTSGREDGEGAAARFSAPRHCCLSADGTKLLVADQGNGAIRMVVLAAPEPLALPSAPLLAQRSNAPPHRFGPFAPAAFVQDPVFWGGGRFWS